jgi:proteasome lid subunit RPN8/RPN11
MIRGHGDLMNDSLPEDLEEMFFDFENVELEEVLIPVKVFTRILTHVISFNAKNKKYEYAGILTGLLLGEAIIVTGAYPARKVNASHTSFTIPDSELIRIDEERIRDNQPGFVGLYHLHPGFGVFLSSIDVETTERFCRFYGKSINLVISLNNGSIQYKFFTAREGRSKELRYRFLVG